MTAERIGRRSAFRLGHAEATANTLRQAIALTEHDGSREEYGTVVGSVGAALMLLEESDAAATVLAAAEQVLGAEFLYLSLGVQQRQIDDRLRDRLGDVGFSAARARGASMTEDAVNSFVAEALARLPSGGGR